MTGKKIIATIHLPGQVHLFAVTGGLLLASFFIMASGILAKSNTPAIKPASLPDSIYADREALSAYSGSLILEFAIRNPNRLVLAYGRRYRKDRFSRKDTTEEERNLFKPIKAEIQDDGTKAVFTNMPPDYYDLIVINPRDDIFYEGLQLLQRVDETEIHSKGPDTQMFQEVTASLERRSDRIGGWDAFFDRKNFIRLETDGKRGAILVHQRRTGKTLAHSGNVLSGNIHSIDIVWLERAAGDAGWQVLSKQQLFRAELTDSRFFKHKFIEILQGIRVGIRETSVGPITLPHPDYQE